MCSHEFKDSKTVPMKWASHSYKLSYNPYKWTCISITGVISYDVQVVGPHLVDDFIIPKFVSGEIFTVVKTST